MLSIEDIENMPDMTLSTKQAAEIIGCSEKMLRSQLVENPNFFGFPVIIISGKSGYKKIRIPKLPFINYLTFGMMDD